MGQLFNRMFRIAKSYLNEAETKGYGVAGEDEDLKKIIDELNNKQKREQEKQSEGKRAQSSAEEKKAQDTYEKKMGLNLAYKALALNPQASPEEIKAAYKRKIKEYHPDLVSNMGEEIRVLAAQKTRLIIEAYEYIRKAKGF
jgi:DnaJ-domain-containing protein 1